MSAHDIDAGLSTDEGARSNREKPLPTVAPYVRLVSLLGGRCKGLVQWWWAWEVLATAIAIAPIVSLAVVLSQSDGCLRKSWAFGATQLTFNTIVAFLSTVI